MMRNTKNIVRTNNNKTDEINSLKKEIETLKKENLKLRNEKVNFIAKIKTLENENTILKKQINYNKVKTYKKSGTQKMTNHHNNNYDFDLFKSPFFMNFENNYNHNNYDDYDDGAEYAIQAVEQQIMDEICPNPDKMTYEQLLAMEEKVGNVNKGLTKEKINKIPIIYFKKSYSKDNNKCIICQDDFRENEKVKKLSCEHLYHINCIDQWLKKEKKCPFCNKEI